MRRLAVLIAAAVCAVAPPVAEARTDDFAKPVLFIPGPEQTNPSCSPFDDMQVHFNEYTTSVGGAKIGFAGTMVALGLYGGSGGCSDTVGAARGDSLAELGAKLATWIKAKYPTQAIDIVAHGGGGLVVRSALAKDPKLKVEDVVTLGTPHAGSAALAAACGSRPVCGELAPGGATPAKNPQGAGGTDWSAIGSEADTLVQADSAVGMDAEHKTIYRAGGPSHDALLTDVDDAQDADIRYSHGAAKWVEWNNAPHSVNRVAEDLIFGAGSSAGACGLQATQPELCGQTPVILVPGFGASQIECTTQFGTGNLWPDALLNPNQYLEMALSSDGKGAWKDSACAKSSKANGHLVYSVAGGKQNIHGESWKWIQRIAPGRAYEFGWDFRKGPDQTLARFDKFIDEVRAKHGAQRVALVAHSYGGMLSRWYIDDPARARKVARVANFASPWWGAPKAWFAMAYGYEQPGFSPIDVTVPRATFRIFSRNLAGLYYLIPPQAWFDRAPAVVRNWLEINDTPVTSSTEAIDAIREFGGNASLAADIARNHADKLDGFKRTNGVDWRIFIGSGLATMGHVRAYSGTDNVQYSWINGDGTVPLFSQRQSPTAASAQMGDKTPTYNFCGIAHMGEMEDKGLQDATTPFVATGADPIVDGNVLKGFPCHLNESEFAVTGDEDKRSLELSKAASAGVASVRGARASQAAAPATMTLDQAEAAGLVEVMDDAGRTTFVTHVPLNVRASGSATVQVTPITGEGKRGAARVYELDGGTLDFAARGAKTEAYRGGAPVAGRAADRKPPRTKVKARRAGSRVVLTAKATDASGVAVTMVKVGKARPRPWKKALKVSRRMTVRYWSVDTFGNAERQHVRR